MSLTVEHLRYLRTHYTGVDDTIESVKDFWDHPEKYACYELVEVLDELGLLSRSKRHDIRERLEILMMKEALGSVSKDKMAKIAMNFAESEVERSREEIMFDISMTVSEVFLTFKELRKEMREAIGRVVEIGKVNLCQKAFDKFSEKRVKKIIAMSRLVEYNRSKRKYQFVESQCTCGSRKNVW